MTNSGHNMSGASIAGGAGGWLGFSLSPHVAMDAAAGSGFVDVAGHHHAHHGGVYYHPDAVASSPMSFYFGGSDNVSAASGVYYSGISALPLRSDGSLCLADALRRSEQKHHGKYLHSTTVLTLLQFGLTELLASSCASLYVSWLGLRSVQGRRCRRRRSSRTSSARVPPWR